MLEFDITIYMDALNLLLSDKTNIRAEIYNQIAQGDPCLESLETDIWNTADDKNIDADKVVEIFNNDDLGNLMKYIHHNESTITFDYGESAACCDLKVVAFNVPCELDIDKYLDNIKGEL